MNQSKEEKCILKEDGLIYWIENCPSEPEEGQRYMDRLELYYAALQSAIDSAVKVSNQKEVKINIYVNNPGLQYIIVGQVYSLKCAVERKTTYDPCNNQLCKDGFVKAFYSLQFCDVCKGTGGINPKTVALVTFPQSKEDNPIRTKEEIIKAVIQVCKAHAEDGCLDIEGSEANALRIVGPWIDQISSSYRSGEESKWISVSDRLPQNNETVLCYSRDFRSMRQNSYSEYTDQDSRWFIKNFSHWQPLPEPPKNP